MEVLGPHQRTEVCGWKDDRSRHVVTCHDCETIAYAYDVAKAKANLIQTPCNPGCENCKNLRRSSSEQPAEPMGQDCAVVLHVCPNDGKRWWQSNTDLHSWQEITDDKEWEVVQRRHLEGGESN